MTHILLTLAAVIAMSSTTNFYSFSLNDINGKDHPLDQYKNKVVLVVNVASFCGYTKQYAGLEELYQKYKEKGFVVLGVPSNDFGAQEPGTNEEIKEFCSTKYSVTFPLLSKVEVKGDNKTALYAWLTASKEDPDVDTEVQWNFEKFLIGKDGQIVNRYASNITPQNAELITAIEAALAK